MKRKSIGIASAYILGSGLAVSMKQGYYHLKEYAGGSFIVLCLTYVLIGFILGWKPVRDKKSGSRWWVMGLLLLGLAALSLFPKLPIPHMNKVFLFFLKSHSQIPAGLLIGYAAAAEFGREIK